MFPGLKITVDTSALTKRFTEKRMRAAMTAALRRVSFQYLTDVRRGFNVNGVHPVTGQDGVWPKRVIPEFKEYKTFKRGKRKGETVLLPLESFRYARDKVGNIIYRDKQVKDKKTGRTRTVTEPVKVKVRLRREGKTLIQTGRLLDSINESQPKQTEGGVEISVGTNVSYAKYHQQKGNLGDAIVQRASGKQAVLLQGLGFKDVRKGSKITLPARPFLVMPEKWQKKYQIILQEETIRELNSDDN